MKKMMFSAFAFLTMCGCSNKRETSPDRQIVVPDTVALTVTHPDAGPEASHKQKEPCKPVRFVPIPEYHFAGKGNISCRVTAAYEYPPYIEPHRFAITDRGYEVAYSRDPTICDDDWSQGIQRFDADGSPDGPPITWENRLMHSRGGTVAGAGVSLWIYRDQYKRNGHVAEDNGSWFIDCLKDQGSHKTVIFKGDYPLAVWHHDRFILAVDASGVKDNQGAVKFYGVSPDCQITDLPKALSTGAKDPFDTRDDAFTTEPTLDMVSADNLVGAIFYYGSGKIRLAVLDTKSEPFHGSVRTIVDRALPRFKNFQGIRLSGAGKYLLLQWFEKGGLKPSKVFENGWCAFGGMTKFEFYSARGRAATFTGGLSVRVLGPDVRYRLVFKGAHLSARYELERLDRTGKVIGSLNLGYQFFGPARLSFEANANGLMAFEENIIRRTYGTTVLNTDGPYRLTFVNCQK